MIPQQIFSSLHLYIYTTLRLHKVLSVCTKSAKMSSVKNVPHLRYAYPLIGIGIFLGILEIQIGGYLETPRIAQMPHFSVKKFPENKQLYQKKHPEKSKPFNLSIVKPSDFGRQDDFSLFFKCKYLNMQVTF